MSLVVHLGSLVRAPMPVLTTSPLLMLVYPLAFLAAVAAFALCGVLGATVRGLVVSGVPDAAFRDRALWGAIVGNLGAMATGVLMLGGGRWFDRDWIGVHLIIVCSVAAFLVPLLVPNALLRVPRR